ncbi:MAG: flagellar biosynthesis protein FlhB [Deltaproteobacteria bacterium]|jgi:flagellar biosynthetic protein FlhB|nr:flagellar biosynthesis protein FlhB [Deltaproteobacteria bacterium]
MPQSDPSRTEKPTPKRLNKARSEGNVPKSQEVGNAVTILSGAIGLYFWLSYVAKDMMGIYRFFLGEGILTFQAREADVTALLPWLATELARMVLPIILFIGFCCFIVTRAQVGKLWAPKVFKPKLSKLNPLKGMKRMFLSLQTFMRLGKSLLKALVIGLAVYIVIKDELPHLTGLYYTTAEGLAAYILDMSFTMTLYALVPMLILAVGDFFYSRWDYIENLKMTKDEVKDEMKQMEGDPQVKGKMKQKMFQMSQRRMMQQVPKADVVITNPTHFAVALSYNPMESPAPLVVAKGVDKVAEKIKEIARENRVPIRENKPLARALYSQVEIGEMIPEDLYKAVAAILAQLWKNKGGKQVDVGR